MRCPRGMSTIRYTRFSYKKILMGKKKIVVLCLDVIMIAFLPEKYTVNSLLGRNALVNTERVPSGHPKLLLKSNKFNMAAVSLKRPIV